MNHCSAASAHACLLFWILTGLSFAEKFRSEHPDFQVLKYAPHLRDVQIADGWAIEVGYVAGTYKKASCMAFYLEKPIRNGPPTAFLVTAPLAFFSTASTSDEPGSLDLKPEA